MTPEEFYDRFILALTSMKDKYELDSLHDALVLWFAENYLLLDPEDVRERIVKDSHAEGVDAVLIDPSNHDLLFVQARTAETFGNTNSNYGENNVKLTLQGMRFLLRGDYKGKITPSLENLVDEYHDLDHTEDYKTKVLFLTLKKPPISNKFVELFRQDIPQVEVAFWGFQQLFTFYKDTYLPRTDPPPKLVSFRMITKSLAKPSPHESRVFTTRGEELARVYDEYGERIFQQNVRHSLGMRSKSINQQILETAIDAESNNFWYFNNGITMVCTNLSETTAGTVIKLANPQIINGAQTTYALHNAYKSGKLRDGVEVLIKAIQTSDKDFMENVTLYTNSQNAIRLRDLCSNDKIQRVVQKILSESYGYFYERKRGEFNTLYPTVAAKENVFGEHYQYKLLTNENAAQAFLAVYLSKPSQAKTEKARIFARGNGGFYSQVFNESDSLLPEKLLLSWKLLKYVENRKSDYKKQYQLAKELTEGEKNDIYRYDFLLHSEYFIINILADFLRNRGFDIDQQKDHILETVSKVDSCATDIKEDYETIKNELADFMDEIKKGQGYYHNKFFKNERSIGLVRTFFGKKYGFIEPIPFALKKAIMNVKCPVCGKVTTNWMNLAKHFRVLAEPKHIEWIESRGLSYPELIGLKDGKLGKGNLRPLVELLQKEAGEI